MEKAYTVYEEEITDSQAQYQAMNLMIPTLNTLSLSEDDTMTLLAKTAQHCSRALKKSDQVALVSLVSHLFWRGPGGDGGARVMECMQRAVRIASGMAEAQAVLFAEILNEYLYYYACGNEQVTPTFLNAILELVASKHATAEDTSPLYSNTLKLVARLRKENPARYGELKV